MRHIFVLIATCILVFSDRLAFADDHTSFAQIKSGDARAQEDGFKALTQLRQRIIADLIEVIESKSKQTVSQGSIEKAIELLGEFRAREGVPILQTNITYPHGFDPQDKSFPQPFVSGGLFSKSPRDLCPSVRSLIAIGSSAHDPIIERLIIADDPFEVAALVDVLRGIQLPSTWHDCGVHLTPQAPKKNRAILTKQYVH